MIVVVQHCGITAITEVQDGGTSSLAWRFSHQMFNAQNNLQIDR